MLEKPREQPHLSFEQGSSFTPPPVLFLLSCSNCFNKQKSFHSRAFCPFSCQSLALSPCAVNCFVFSSSDPVFRFLLRFFLRVQVIQSFLRDIHCSQLSKSHSWTPNGAGSPKNRGLLSAYLSYVHKLTFLCANAAS